jgi:AAA domain
MSVIDFVPEEDSASPLFGWCHHCDEDPTPTPWLIKNILPETGGALISGQWGTYKTTVALDIATSVMTKVPFANRYTVKRAGGVTYLALEGFGSLASRLTAISRLRGSIAPLPFLYRPDCPALTAADALDKLTALVERAIKEIQDKFSVPTVLIVIDTIISAAGYAKAGDDNDAAIAQRLMSVLSGLSHRTGALAIGIDHFGKITDTGTRGSSAKEGHADAVLALLAERELNGTVTGTRLAVRKLRDGPSGLEIPFTPKIVEIGTDPDGDPITRVVIDWQQQTAKPADANWSKSLRLLRQVLMTMLADAGIDTAPFADGPVVRAVDIKLVRNEFYRQYPADGDEQQKATTRRQAFYRAVKDAQAKRLVTTREVGGVQLIWLTRPEVP